MEDFGAFVVLAMLVSVFALFHAPDHWKTPLGLAITAVVIVPAGMFAVSAIVNPLILMPLVFIAGASLIPWKR